MSRIVRYNTEELKTLPPLDIDNLPDIIDKDIEFDASHDITDDMVISLKRSVGRPKKKERLKRVEILLDNQTLEWLKKTGRGWTTRLRKTIQDLRAKNLL